MTFSHNMLAGFFSFIFGTIYFLLTINTDRATVGNPLAPLVFPVIVAVGLIILGLYLIISEVLKKKMFERKQQRGASEIYQLRLIIFTCISALLYALLFEKTGYVISTIIFIGSILFLLRGVKKWKSNCTIAFVFSVGIYVVFVNALGIPLPALPVIGI